MAESSGLQGKKQRVVRIFEISADEPRLYRIVEVSPEELEGLQLSADEGGDPNARNHYDADSHGHHGHSHGGTGGDHDIDHDSGGHGGFHYHQHPV